MTHICSLHDTLFVAYMAHLRRLHDTYFTQHDKFVVYMIQSFLQSVWHICSLQDLYSQSASWNILPFTWHITFVVYMTHTCGLHGIQLQNVHLSSASIIHGYFSRQEYFSQLQDTTDALPCHIHLPVCLWIMDPQSRAPKKNTGHGNAVLQHDTTHLIRKPG